MHVTTEEMTRTRRVPLDVPDEWAYKARVDLIAKMIDKIHKPPYMEGECTVLSKDNLGQKI